MTGTAEQAFDQSGAGSDEPARQLERLLLGSEPAYTRQQVAERAGVSLDRAALLWRSLGFAAPDDADVVFTDADVDALKIVAGLYESGVTDATIELTLTRALSQAMARLTEWQVDILHSLATSDVEDGPQPHAEQAGHAEHAEQAGHEAGHEAGHAEQAGPDASRLAAAAALIPLMEHLQQYVWRRHLLAASDRRSAITGTPSETAPLAVGFADIVGFTSISRGLDETRLAEFLEAFEATTSAVVAEHGGRVIKTVGDEVMFAAERPAAAADIGLELAGRVSALDGRPDLRIGIAYGPVLRRVGDAYGTVVNLASRLTALARPGAALVDRELAHAIRDEPGYRLTKLRRVSVRGFAHLQPWVLNRR